MANIIFKVVTVYVPKRLTDEALGEKMAEVVAEERKKMSDTKVGGAFQNSHVRYIRGWWWFQKPRYRIILTFLSFK